MAVPFIELTDTFSSGTLDTATWSQNYGTVSVVSGKANIAATSGYTGLRSGSNYVLQGSEVVAQLFPAPVLGATTNELTFLVLTSTGGTDAGFQIDTAAGVIRYWVRAGYADGGQLTETFSAADHAWVRLRESGGTLSWATSPDGANWTVRRTAASPSWTGSDLFQSLVAETHRVGGTDTSAQVDNVNAPPARRGSMTPTYRNVATLTAAPAAVQATMTGG